jgi:2-amino-4-hydroxy-6-hydroxymethyldihydropteridine diphosphokinase
MSAQAVTGKIDATAHSAQQTAIVAMGSNQAHGATGPSGLLEAAISELQMRGFVIRARSRYFSTPAFPAGSGPDFVNAVIEIETQQDAPQLLAQLHSVEALMGRARTVRWGVRTLDLDLVALGGQVLPDLQTHQYWRELPLEDQLRETPEQLILPHPRLSERAFVLVPMMDVAPDWVHPVTRASVRQMFDALPRAAKAEVVPLAEGANTCL